MTELGEIRKLNKARNAAREVVNARTDHILPAAQRWRILAAFGPRCEGNQPWKHPEALNRALLSLSAARRALALYKEQVPACDAVPAAFDGAAALLAGKISPSVARLRLDAGVEEVQSFKTPGPAAIYAGNSVLEALVCVLQDNFFVDPGSEAPEPEDAQTGGDDNDAASFAAAAFARAAQDRGGDPSEARRQFWTWWLDEAVPAAWEGRDV